MNSESSICMLCPLSKVCNTRLEPEVINPRNNRVINIDTQGKGMFSYLDCRHFTCDQNGARAAVNQYNLIFREHDNFEVTYGTNNVSVVKGRKFYSTDKPIPSRIVDERGYIYSLIDIKFPEIGYAYTGRRVTQSSILTEPIIDSNYKATQKEVWLRFVDQCLREKRYIKKEELLAQSPLNGIDRFWALEIISNHANCIIKQNEDDLIIPDSHRRQVSAWKGRLRVDYPNACIGCKTNPDNARTTCPILFGD